MEEVRHHDVGDFSPGLKKHLREYYGYGDNDATWEQPGELEIPDRNILARTVKQYTPIWREQTSRFMNDFRWFHGIGSPLVEPEDMNTWGELCTLRRPAC